MELEFEAEVIEWRGPSPYIYAVLLAEPAAAVARVKRAASYGWGVIPVSQFRHFARMRAKVVLPTPRVPVKR